MKRIKKDSTPATKADVKEIVTQAIDNFAIIMKRSFDDVHEQMGGMVTKDEFIPFKNEMIGFKKDTEQSLYELKSDVSDLKTRMTKVENRLDGMDSRFDTTDEKLDLVIDLQKNHEKRITKIETKFA